MSWVFSHAVFCKLDLFLLFDGRKWRFPFMPIRIIPFLHQTISNVPYLKYNSHVYLLLITGNNTREKWTALAAG
jgi:hypothetical protein